MNAVVTNIEAIAPLTFGDDGSFFCRRPGIFYLQLSLNGWSLGQWNQGSVWNQEPVGIECPRPIGYWNPGAFGGYLNNGRLNVLTLSTNGDLCLEDITLYIHYDIPGGGGSEDSDGDGITNANDNCPTHYNPAQINWDGDGYGNACDNCVNIPNGSQANSDPDPLGDACDNCVLISNSSQGNSDADSFGDVCDNCPVDSNPEQEDVDGDGVGDQCDDPCRDVEPTMLFFGLPNKRVGRSGGECVRYRIYIPTNEKGLLSVYFAENPGESQEAELVDELTGAPVPNGSEVSRGHYLANLRDVGTHDVWARFIQEGRSRRRPWNFYFWRVTGDKIETSDLYGRSEKLGDDVYQWDLDLLCPWEGCPDRDVSCRDTRISVVPWCETFVSPDPPNFGLTQELSPFSPAYVPPSGTDAPDNIQGYIFAGRNGVLESQPLGDEHIVRNGPYLFDPFGPLHKYDERFSGWIPQPQARDDELSFGDVSRGATRGCACTNIHYQAWAPGWQGHCREASFASSLILQPNPVPDSFGCGGGICTFTIDDLEGLWTEAVSLGGQSTCPSHSPWMHGTRIPRVRPTIATAEPVDSWPAIVHETLYQEIYEERSHVLADLGTWLDVGENETSQSPLEVWYHIIYKFDAEWVQKTNSLSRRDYGDPDRPDEWDVSITMKVFANVDDWDPNPTGDGSPNGCDGETHAADLEWPAYDGHPSAETGCAQCAESAWCWKDRVITYNYDVVLDSVGRFIRTHPRQNWRSIGPSTNAIYPPNYLWFNLRVDWAMSARSVSEENRWVWGNRVRLLDQNTAGLGSMESCSEGIPYDRTRRTRRSR